jgi:hypothetical protein
MKQLYLILIFNFLVSNLLSQEIKPSWSSINTKNTETTFHSLQFDTDEILVFMNEELRKNYLKIDRFDTLNNLIGSIEVSVNAQEIVKTVALNNEIIVFTNDHILEKRIDQLSVFVFDKTGKQTYTETLFEQPSNGGYKNNFDISVAPNGQFFAVVCSEAFNEKLNENIHIKILDRSLKVIQSKVIHTPILSDKRRVNIPVVNNLGTVYLLKKYKIKLDNIYQLYSIDKSGVETKTDLKLRIKKIADFTYTLDQEGNLVLGGFYSSIGKINFEGVFIAKYKQNLQNDFLKEYMLNENIVSAFKSKKEIEMYGQGLDNFKVVDCFYLKEDQIVLIADHISSYTDPKEGHRDFRKGFVTISFTSEGGFLFSTPVITDQQDATDKGRWSSYCKFTSEQNIVFWHNVIGPSVKKIKLTGPNRPYLPAQQVMLNNQGILKTTLLEYTTEMPSGVLVANAYLNHKSHKYVILESSNKERYIIGRIVIQE